jgi:hypothetical protein
MRMTSASVRIRSASVSFRGGSFHRSANIYGHIADPLAKAE